MNKESTRLLGPRFSSSLSERAFSKLSRKILSGEYEPGKWIRKTQLSKELGMSPTPVKDAIRRLQYSGLLEVNPRWEVRVKVWTVAEIRQLSNMRVCLEGLVAREAAVELEEAQVAKLRESAVQTDAALARFHHEDQMANVAVGEFELFGDDIVFHRTLAHEARMFLVAREIDRLDLLQATCRRYAPGGCQQTVSHQAIIDAIATRDSRTAEMTMQRHIQESIDDYLPKLRDQFGEGPVLWRSQDGNSLSTSRSV